MSRQVKWVHSIAVLAAPASPLFFGCGGNSGVAAAEGRASSDSGTVPEAQIGDVAAADGAVEGAGGESGVEASVEAAIEGGDADGGCASQFQVHVAASTDEAYLLVSPDGRQCSVGTAPAADAVLGYKYEGLGAGDLPSGIAWVPTGSPWNILTPDGGLHDQGQSAQVTLQCSAGSPAVQTSLRLTNVSGGTLSLSVGCIGGLTFVVLGLSFTSGSALVDASQEVSREPQRLRDRPCGCSSTPKSTEDGSASA